MDEENDKNGVLEFIPQSHTMNFTADQFDQKEYFLSNYTPNQALINTKQQNKLQKGDVILFHCRLLHRANKNSTNQVKISFVYTVKSASSKALEETRSSRYPEIYLD